MLTKDYPKSFGDEMVFYDDHEQIFILQSPSTGTISKIPEEVVKKFTKDWRNDLGIKTQANYLMDWLQIATEDGLVAKPKKRDRRRELLLL